MYSIFRYAKRVAIRRIVYIVIACIISFLISMYSSGAIAQSSRYVNCRAPEVKYANCETKSDAIEQASRAAGYQARNPAHTHVCPYKIQSNQVVIRVVALHIGCNRAGGTYVSRRFDAVDATNCPPGSGPKPGYPGECLTSDDCLAKNADGKMGGVRSWSSRCLANGCEVAFNKNASDYVNTVIGGRELFTGTIEYTGKVCTAPDQWTDPTKPQPPPLPPSEEPSPNLDCVVVSPAGQTACVKSNGDICATASTGREICWSPGETGRKTDKNVVQDKKAGDQTMPPSISIDNGDTANKSKEDVKVVEKFGDGRVSTTTIGTYETNSGANAGSSNQGSNSGGSGGSSNGQDGGQDGGKEGGTGTYSGGETCDSPPVSTGDAQLAGIIHQQWLERCGEGAGLEVDVDTDPSSVFPNPSEGVGFDTRTVDSLGLDSSGFIGGGGSCPALADAGGSGKLSGAFATYLVSPPAWWCNLVAAIHYVMMALGAIASVYIMAGRKN